MTAKVRKEIFEKIKKQFEYVRLKSEFYQAKIGPVAEISEAGFFTDIPFTTKQELLTDQLEHPPFGSNLCVIPEKIRRIHKTSGTTSKPLLLALTALDIETTVEIGRRCFISSGLTGNDTVLHCLNYNMWIGGYTDHQSLEATGAAVIPFGVGNTENLVETILLIKPTAIHCTPSYLNKIALVLKQDFNLAPKELRLKLGLFGGESGLQNLHFRENIEKTWGIKAMNANYGMADVLSMFGAECSLQNGLHFMGDEVLFPEILDPVSNVNKEIHDGVEGELILTNLVRESQPLLRYRTNDIIRILSVDPCSCGNKGFRFEVIGRSDDMITIKGVNVFVSAIEKIIFMNLELLTGVLQIHVNNHDPIDKLLIKLETKLQFPGPDIDFKTNLVREIKNRIAITPEIEFLPEGSLPRTEGKSRKIFRTL